MRNGNYTLFSGYELKIFTIRQERFVTEDETSISICSDEIEVLSILGFVKHPHEPMFCKDITLKQLDNAFFVITFGLYNDIKVEVSPLIQNTEFTVIYTNDPRAEGIGFIKTNHTKWKYGKDVKVTELSKLWEERTESSFNKKMPEGLERYKEIPLP